MPKTLECDGQFPEGFSKEDGIPAQALRAANSLCCDLQPSSATTRQYQVKVTAQSLINFAETYYG